MQARSFIFFLTGFIVGSVATYCLTNKYFDKKYADLADAEIQSVKESFAKHRNSQMNLEKPPIEKMAEVVSQYQSGPVEVEESENVCHLIREDEFGDCDYNCVTMTYYSDGILVEDLSDTVVNIDDVVGYESLEHFGDPSMGYEECVVYVRNNILGEDIEITVSPQRYSEI